mmetsp:Transcript_29738/g.72437  ORF Transcript_29738/g.72437 Transcript_29738/m.72437 type:complete len:432 (+) Transcript_29738:190-1485(+)
MGSVLSVILRLRLIPFVVRCWVLLVPLSPAPNMMVAPVILMCFILSAGGSLLAAASKMMSVGFVAGLPAHEFFPASDFHNRVEGMLLRCGNRPEFDAEFSGTIGAALALGIVLPDALHQILPLQVRVVVPLVNVQPDGPLSLPLQFLVSASRRRNDLHQPRHANPRIVRDVQLVELVVLPDERRDPLAALVVEGAVVDPQLFDLDLCVVDALDDFLYHASQHRAAYPGPLKVELQPYDARRHCSLTRTLYISLGPLKMAAITGVIPFFLFGAVASVELALVRFDVSDDAVDILPPDVRAVEIDQTPHIGQQLRQRDICDSQLVDEVLAIRRLHRPIPRRHEEVEFGSDRSNQLERREEVDVACEEEQSLDFFFSPRPLAVVLHQSANLYHLQRQGHVDLFLHYRIGSHTAALAFIVALPCGERLQVDALLD